MGSIVIVGLGPGARDQVTREAEALIEAAAREDRLVLRTRIHPTVESWSALTRTPSMDAHYEHSADFDTAYSAIAEELLTRAAALPAGASLVYAVPGHPLVGESTASRIFERAAGAGVDVRVVAGISFLDAVAVAVGADIGAGLRVADALALGRIDPTVPLLVCQVYSRRIAGHVKLALGKHYPDEHLVTLVHAAGVPGEERIERVRLYEIDRSDTAAHLTSLWVPALAPLEALREPETLREVMAALRAPEPDGCPWDREQTHETLRRYLLEETYEALDALDAGDMTSLEEELGDLLLQIVFHAQIADEAGLFDLGDVVSGITRKLIRRHPHVFGDLKEQDSEAVLRNWEALKRAERAEKDQHEKSMLDGVPLSMPALSYAQSVHDRAARVGFDWPDVNGVLDKIAEETRELVEAETLDQKREEFGDLLFVLVRLAGWMGLDAEDTLRAANRKFRTRFSAMERAARAEQKTLDQYDSTGLEALWNRAKASIPG
jgi:tetrapyrrole methylase family protein / MazG family protein